MLNNLHSLNMYSLEIKYANACYYSFTVCKSNPFSQTHKLAFMHTCGSVFLSNYRLAFIINTLSSVQRIRLAFAISWD